MVDNPTDQLVESECVGPQLGEICSERLLVKYKVDNTSIELINWAYKC